MSLTDPQKATLKADINANTNTILVAGVQTQIKDTVNNGDINVDVAAWYNLPTASFWVWRSFVRDQDIYSLTTVDATTWSWTIFIGRSQGERDAWRQMVNMAGGLNPSLTSVRAGVADIFSGAGGAAQRTHLLTIGRRLATNAEKLFSTGTGDTANPATMTYEGPVIGGDITAARNS